MILYEWNGRNAFQSRVFSNAVPLNNNKQEFKNKQEITPEPASSAVAIQSKGKWECLLLLQHTHLYSRNRASSILGTCFYLQFLLTEQPPNYSLPAAIFWSILFHIPELLSSWHPFYNTPFMVLGSRLLAHIPRPLRGLFYHFHVQLNASQ